MRATAGDALQRGLDLLTEYGWTKGAFARNEDGQPTWADSHEALSFCAVGALYRAVVDLRAGQHVYAEALAVLDKHARLRRHWITRRRIRNVNEFNDSQRSFEEVRHLYKMAIAWQRTREQRRAETCDDVSAL